MIKIKSANQILGEEAVVHTHARAHNTSFKSSRKFKQTHNTPQSPRSKSDRESKRVLRTKEPELYYTQLKDGDRASDKHMTKSETLQWLVDWKKNIANSLNDMQGLKYEKLHIGRELSELDRIERLAKLYITKHFEHTPDTPLSARVILEYILPPAPKNNDLTQKFKQPYLPPLSPVFSLHDPGFDGQPTSQLTDSTSLYDQRGRSDIQRPGNPMHFIGSKPTMFDKCVGKPRKLDGACMFGAQDAWCDSATGKYKCSLSGWTIDRPEDMCWFGTATYDPEKEAYTCPLSDSVDNTFNTDKLPDLFGENDDKSLEANLIRESLFLGDYAFRRPQDMIAHYNAWYDKAQRKIEEEAMYRGKKDHFKGFIDRVMKHVRYLSTYDDFRMRSTSTTKVTNKLLQLHASNLL